GGDDLPAPLAGKRRDTVRPAALADTLPIVFFSQLAEQAGYRIDAAKFAPDAPLCDEFVRARFHSQDTGRNDQLAAVLAQAVNRSNG
ncbi:MAG: hypothetical protein VB093_01485, partial [Propionicimonas sp.]|nr:hypothetical protein [Propionicimonas sp.]